MNQKMENLHKTKIVLFYLLFLFIISCKNNKQDTKFNTIKEKTEILSKDENSICLEPHFLCKKINDKEGVKHIVVDEKRVISEVYDAIEEEKVINTSIQLIFKIFLNNKEYVKVFDEETTCFGNSEVKIIEDSIKITDLDDDGINEVTFLYDLICREIISPSKMKLIMIEGNTKFKIRGMKKFFDNSNEDIAFNIDKSFKLAPKKFLDFATNLWNNNLYDSFVGKMTKEKMLIMDDTKNKILKEKEIWVKAKINNE